MPLDRDTDKTSISLIIPAYNEAKYIARTLDSVMKARDNFYKPSLIEVIVVNNSSTDNTENIAKSFGAQVVLEEQRRIASVRNKGASIAHGEVIGFLDADSRITLNMFNSIHETMASGRYIGGGTNVKIDRMSLGIFFTCCITIFPARWFLGVMGGLIFVKKTAFDQLHGFDDSLYCAEDSKFIIGLKRHGKQTGKKFKIITRDYVVTSARSFDRLGDWYYFKYLPRVLAKGGLSAFKDVNIVKGFWYDVKR